MGCINVISLKGNVHDVHQRDLPQLDPLILSPSSSAMVCINVISLNGNVLVTANIDQDALLATLRDQATAALGVRGTCALVLPGVGKLGGDETAASLQLSDGDTLVAIASGVKASSITMPYTWARQLLESSPTFRQRAALERFQKFDVSETGTLSWKELVALTANLCEFLGLDQPEEGKLQTLFDCCDKNYDEVLQEKEFVRFFETYLRSALPLLSKIENRTDTEHLNDVSKATEEAKAMYKQWLGSKVGAVHLAKVQENERLAGRVVYFRFFAW